MNKKHFVIVLFEIKERRIAVKKWIVFDAMGVIFKVGDDTNELLVPYIKKLNKGIEEKR